MGFLKRLFGGNSHGARPEEGPPPASLPAPTATFVPPVQAPESKFRRRTMASLAQMEEADITHVTFSSSLDERCTPLERELEGRRMTIREARALVETRESEIGRSVFLAEVKFG